ncbi:MAG TPA: PEGA domain-containing protein [Kofleriaceae bacterium]|nr:PEGA domain-containing protein [Kofleriaceae bacterium]
MPGAVSRARADGSVLVLGEVSPQQRELIASAVVATARDGGWRLTPRASPDEETDLVAACLRAAKPWSCVASQMQDKGDQLVVVQVDLERTDTVLSVHVVTAASDAASTANHFCNACDDDSLKLAVSDVTRRLLRDAAERSGTTRISIASEPDSAWITLDGKPAGSTNTIRPTYPGEHTVMLTRAGYATATRTVHVKEGELLPLNFNLVSSTVIDESGDPRARSSRRVPLLLIGTGAVALAGGAVLFGVDEDPSPIGPQPPRYYDTVPHGIGAALVGTAAIGTGLYLWWRASRASRASRSTSSPTLAPSLGGAAVGGSGRF